MQKTDLPIYLSDMYLDLAVANFAQFLPELTNVEPETLVDIFDKIGMTLLRYKPADKNAPDPFKRETDEDREQKRLNDEIWLEMENQKQAAEAAEVKRLSADPWNMDF